MQACNKVDSVRMFFIHHEWVRFSWSGWLLLTSRRRVIKNAPFGCPRKTLITKTVMWTSDGSVGATLLNSAAQWSRLRHQYTRHRVIAVHLSPASCFSSDRSINIPRPMHCCLNADAAELRDIAKMADDNRSTAIAVYHDCDVVRFSHGAVTGFPDVTFTFSRSTASNFIRLKR